jgi:hypothetical protein
MAAPTLPQVRGTAILTAGVVSAFCVLWTVRGMVFNGVTMWLSPLPLLAAAWAFGPAAAAMAALVAGLPLLVASWPAAVAHGLAVGLPVVLCAWLAWGAPPGAPPRLGPPVVALAMLAAASFLAAAIAMADHAGGLHGALAEMFYQALRQSGTAMDANIRQLADLVARVVPLAIGLWFLGAMALNASIAQNLVNRFGLLARPPVRWSQLALPRWYLPLPIIAGIAVFLLPEGPRYAAGGVAEILVLPYFLAGLCVVHVAAHTTSSARGWLVAFYIALLIFSAPVLFVVTALGFFDHINNLRGRLMARANSGRANPPPEDRNQ